MRENIQFEHIQKAEEVQGQALIFFDKAEKEDQRKEFNSLLTRISPEIYAKKLNTIRSQRCKGTGIWLLKDLQFQNWLAKDHTELRLLWLQGIPGAGAYLFLPSSFFFFSFQIPHCKHKLIRGG